MALRIILFFIFFVLATKTVHAVEPPQVIFINQVRGEECCDPGSTNNLQAQIDTFLNNDLPAFFNIRYDALTDPSYIKIFKKYKNHPLINFGVMLEVTPQLAHDALVEYKDNSPNSGNWFHAQNAFLIGYTPEERILLADKVVEKYQDIFGQNPKISTAWQVDTPTLNYLRENYGLQAHQITREQWGVDSYTMDGGPPHYPYLASKNWLFNPDFSDKNNVLIIRQTVIDPLYNYGDNTSAFTSQPNDYALDGKDFTYFKSLLDQVLDQKSQTGFAGLGLENSMPKIHQQEYQKQIDYVTTRKKRGEIEVVSKIESLKSIFSSQKVTIHQSKDLLTSDKQKVFYVTTPRYRLRIRFNNTQVFISDLRLYSPDFIDPYQTQVAINKGYLINPYLINDGIVFPGQRTQTRGQKILGMPVINSFSIEPKKDLDQNINYLELPPVTNFDGISIPSRDTLSYETTQGQISFQFNENTFDLRFTPVNNEIDLKKSIIFHQSSINQNPIKYESTRGGGQIFWQIDGQNAISSVWECEKNICHFEFATKPELFSTIRDKQYPFIFPEKKPRTLSKEKTLVYVHNRYAIAGRNPVRIILVPQDEFGFPTNTKESVKVSTMPIADQIEIEDQETSHEYQILDISHNFPEQIELELNLDDLDLPNEKIYFAPNCQVNFKYCLTHPRQAWWYIQTILADKIRLKLLDENQG